MEPRTVTVEAHILGQAIAEAVQQGGSFVVTVTGNSMHPFLIAGKDRVCLSAPGELKGGDIVFFRRETGEYILHRIVELSADFLTVRGDNQDWTEAVPRDRVIAVASRICRAGRWYRADSPAMRCRYRAVRGLRLLRRAAGRVRPAVHK